MNPAAAPQRFLNEPNRARHIAGVLRDWSLEVTHCGPADLQILKPLIAERTCVYASAVPGFAYQRLAETAASIRAAGFEPVPHVAARHYRDREALDDFLARVSTDAKVRRVLVIGGDRDQALGPFGSALDVVESGLLQRHGITAIDIAGYPDGHPRIDGETLGRALTDKLAAAARGGLNAGIVTQFCFDAERIVDWLRRLRAHGVTAPVRIGMAGPTSFGTLLRFAQRCGVRASIRNLARNGSLIGRLASHAAPDNVIASLADAVAREKLGEVRAHFFSFGGVTRTASFAQAVARGRIVCDDAGGFRVIEG